MSEYFSGDKKILNNIESVPDRRGGSRRLHQRFHVNIDIILECGNIVYKGTLVDISKKGCRVLTDSAIRTASNQLILKYIFPGELDTRIVKGKIKWMEQKESSFLFGIEFEKLQNF
jgi:hypothetical protein